MFDEDDFDTMCELRAESARCCTAEDDWDDDWDELSDLDREM